jgi:hypothetical protein
LKIKQFASIRLKGQCINHEINQKILLNKKITYQNVGGTVKVKCRGRFIAPECLLRNEERAQINDLLL